MLVETTNHKKSFFISVLSLVVLLFFNSLALGQWISVSPPSVSTNWQLYGIHFASPTEGWAVGGDYTNIRGVLLSYSGSTWTSVPPPSVSTNWQLYGVYFTSPSRGMGSGMGCDKSKRCIA